MLQLKEDYCKRKNQLKSECIYKGILFIKVQPDQAAGRTGFTKISWIPYTRQNTLKYLHVRANHARCKNTSFVQITEINTLTAFHGCSDSMSLIRKRCSVSMSTIGKRYSLSMSTIRKRYAVSMSTIRKRYADSISMIRKRCSIFRDLQHKNFFVFCFFLPLVGFKLKFYLPIQYQVVEPYNI